MARQVPSDRLAAVIDAGTAVFVAQGYRRTQMQDVADALGVAKGTLYGAVRGKEALLLACVRYADGLVPLPGPGGWPLPTPAGGELVAVVGDRLGEVADLALSRVPDRIDSSSAVEEIALIVTDLLQRLARHRNAIKLVDRCAPEIPELAQLWFGAGRAQLVERLHAYLDRRADQGLIRLATGAGPGAWDVVARTVVESCVLWAVHRHWDPAPATFRSAQSEAVVAATLSALFADGVAAGPASLPLE
ncbi:MAG: TetR/AcrR family transcriptional regulator [Pseudonocardia sp.]|nr:TetR/AcrR family transcriptional regulator [Pseudonocardia sp.]